MSEYHQEMKQLGFVDVVSNSERDVSVSMSLSLDMGVSQQIFQHSPHSFGVPSQALEGYLLEFLHC